MNAPIASVEIEFAHLDYLDDCFGGTTFHVLTCSADDFADPDAAWLEAADDELRQYVDSDFGRRDEGFYVGRWSPYLPDIDTADILYGDDRKVGVAKRTIHRVLPDAGVVRAGLELLTSYQKEAA